jgi:FdhD protein
VREELPPLLTHAVSAIRLPGAREETDRVAVEEPLEIRIGGEPVAVTMRTPGHDVELALGFLFCEGVIAAAGDVIAARPAGPDAVVVELAAARAPAVSAAARGFQVTSACGVCGRSSIDRLAPPPAIGGRPDEPAVEAAILHALPGLLRSAQPAFSATGGLHAAALVGPRGDLRLAREDVGRHNAVDKVVGALWRAGALPAADGLLVVSGRASYELVDKAARAGIPVLAAVGAPSSLAVETAAAAGLTLIGFLRNDRFNVYTGASRVRA